MGCYIVKIGTWLAPRCIKIRISLMEMNYNHKQLHVKLYTVKFLESSIFDSCG